MSKVHAHTTKVGYFEVEFRDEWKYGTVNTANPVIPYGGESLRALSYKSATKLSNGRDSTPYSRCVGRITSGRSGALKTGQQHVRYNGSVIYQVASLSATGGGCGLSVGSVYVPSHLVDQAIADAKEELLGSAANLLEDFGQAGQVARDLGAVYNKLCDLAWYLQVLFLQDPKKDFYIPGKGNFKGGYGPKRTPTYKALKDYKRVLDIDATARGLPKAALSPKNWAKAWLIWYYGIVPLVSTFEALAASYQGGKFLLIGKGSEKDALPIQDYLAPVYNVVYTGSARRGARCKLVAKVSTTSSLEYFKNLGLSGPGGSATDVDAVTTAWALMPYSFVIDWLVPVEQFLRNLYWDPRIDYMNGYVSKHIDGSGTATLMKFNGNPVKSGNLPRCKVNLLYFQRIPYNNFPPLATLFVRRSLNLNQLTSAVALIVSR